MEQILIDVAVRTTLLAIAIQGLLRLLRIHSAAAQHAAWTTVVVAMLVLPAWALWGPRAYLPVASPTVVRTSMPVAWTTAASPGVDRPAAGTPSIRQTPSAPPTPSRRIAWSTVLWTIYGAGLAILLVRLAAGTVRAWRLMLHASNRGAYLTSGACAAPIAVGWLRPVVILPEQWRAWSASELDMVLAHEQEHVRRRDPLVQWLALLNRAVFWFHPLAWWLERRLALLAEEACDAAVLSRGHRATDYSEYLLGLARAVAGSGARVRVVGNAMPGTFLSLRIRRMLTAGGQLPVSTGRRWTALVGCALLAVILAVIGIRPDRAEARADGSTAQASGGTTRLQEFWFADDEWHIEVASIMTGDELEAYRRLQTTGEREAFVVNFWRRRDPSPGTDANEFRTEFDRRLTYAKEQFADPDSAATFGHETDRGRWYVQFGPPADIVPQRSSAEEWRYASLPGFGANVVVQFDTTSLFGCSWRGGRYRIASPPPLKRFESTSASANASARAYALTFPGRFVYMSFPIDPDAMGVRWGLQSGDATAGRGVPSPDENFEQRAGGPASPIYVQGDINMRARSLVGESLLKHLAGLRFFEPGAIACTEQLPAGAYTLSIESRSLKGEDRTERLTFAVE